MCEIASFIVTKNKVLWLENENSHTKILEKHGLKDDSENPDFVRVEISPENYNYGLPLERWQYNVDQDFLPDWYCAEEAEIATRTELEKWAAVHIIRGGEFTVEEGMFRIFTDNSTGTVNGGEASFYHNSTGAVNSGAARFFDNSTGTVNGGEAIFFTTTAKRLTRRANNV